MGVVCGLENSFGAVQDFEEPIWKLRGFTETISLVCFAQKPAYCLVTIQVIFCNKEYSNRPARHLKYRSIIECQAALPTGVKAPSVCRIPALYRAAAEPSTGDAL